MIISQETINIVKNSVAFNPDKYCANIARYIIKSWSKNESLRVMECKLHVTFGIKKRSMS